MDKNGLLERLAGLGSVAKEFRDAADLTMETYHRMQVAFELVFDGIIEFHDADFQRVENQVKAFNALAGYYEKKFGKEKGEVRMIVGIQKWLSDKRNKVVNSTSHKDLGIYVWPTLHRIGIREVFIDLGRVDMFTTSTIGIKLPTDYEMLKDLLLYLVGLKVHGLYDATGKEAILWLTYY